MPNHQPRPVPPPPHFWNHHGGRREALVVAGIGCADSGCAFQRLVCQHVFSESWRPVVVLAQVTKRPRRHSKRGRCHCGDFHGDSPRTAEAVWVDLEAIIGQAKLLQSRYAHAHDYAYRGSSSSIGIVQGTSGREREGGPTASLGSISGDNRKNELRGYVHNADQQIAEAYSNLRAASTALEKVYGRRNSEARHMARPIMDPGFRYSKGPEIEALKARQRRRWEDGEE